MGHRWLGVDPGANNARLSTVHSESTPGKTRRERGLAFLTGGHLTVGVYGDGLRPRPPQAPTEPVKLAKGGTSRR
jgi:hypothetical protein